MCLLRCQTTNGFQTITVSLDQFVFHLCRNDKWYLGGFFVVGSGGGVRMMGDGGDFRWCTWCSGSRITTTTTTTIIIIIIISIIICNLIINIIGSCIGCSVRSTSVRRTTTASTTTIGVEAILVIVVEMIIMIA